MLCVNEALEKFAREEPLKAELVKLRNFAGLTIEETAAWPLSRDGQAPLGFRPRLALRRFPTGASAIDRQGGERRAAGFHTRFPPLALPCTQE